VSWITITLLVIAALINTFAAYISRVYAEFGKIVPREIQDDLDEWQEKVEPVIGLTREQAALCATVLQQLTFGMFALAIGAVLFDRAPHAARPTYPEIAQAVLVVLMVVVFCNQVLPWLLFTHLKGRWAARLIWPIRLLLWLMTPITVVIRFFFSLAALAEKPVAEDEEPAPDVESLLEAGEEEGILEESDRELVRSAVEFGDKLVREVMTPRPQVFAVPQSITLERFLELLKEHNFSRVPVYERTLDSTTGIAFAHDLLQISDEEARTRTVASIQQPAVFVPETKRGHELLREMQREKQHMRIVIDEYGGVEGLVTIEDLLEQIVGDIEDEYDFDEESGNIIASPDGRFRVRALTEIEQFNEEFGTHFSDEEVDTIGGLVTHHFGRVPHRGEKVKIDDLIFEVLRADARQIHMLLVRRDPLAGQRERDAQHVQT
jgi:CBS domain containing-hemolysin-like protein